jgi:hypothetical protein
VSALVKAEINTAQASPADSVARTSASRTGEKVARNMAEGIEPRVARGKAKRDGDKVILS